MTPRDLPWSPATGQTALRVIAETAERVLCADKTRSEYRSLWTADGALLAVSGASLTLDGLAARPATKAPPAAAAQIPALAPLDAIERATLEALVRAPAGCLALASALQRAADKTFLALLALSMRGYAVAGLAEDGKPRAWSLTPAGAEALDATRARTPAAAPIAAAAVVARAAKQSSQPTQMSLF